MIHFNTNNTSFLKMHVLLKDMGIQNNTFFLQLYDQDLLHINPFDEDNLSQTDKIKVLIEIKRNPWYFFREIVRIPTSSEKTKFELNRGTLAILFFLMLNLEAVIELPRQSYKTYTTAAFYEYLFYFGAENFEGVLFGHNASLVTQNLDRIKEIRNALPKYLNLKRDRYDSDNKSFITYKQPTFTNKLTARAPGTSEAGADKVGRGNSTHVQWWDEIAFIPNVDIQYSAAIYAYTTVARQAERNNESHHIIMTTTAGNKELGPGKWAWEFINKAAEFTELLYDKFYYDKDGVPQFDRESIKEYVRNNALNKTFLYARFMWYELSKPDTYLEEMRSISDSEDAFNREVLLEWTTANSDHPLGKNRVVELRKTIINPYKTYIIDDVYFLKVYRDLDVLRSQSNHIVFGMDCGGNVQQDYSTIVGLDVTNNEVVATMRINQHSAVRFANAVAYMLTHFFPESILVPERNYVGIVIADLIARSIGQHRVYFDEDGKIGKNMDQNLRKLMFNDILRTSIIEYGERIHDSYIIDEITGLIKLKNGRIDHAPGEHDDTLIAYLYTRWFCSYCKTKRNYIDEIYFGFERKNEMNEIELEIHNEKHGKKNVFNSVMNNKSDSNINNPIELEVYDKMGQSIRDINKRAFDTQMSNERRELHGSPVLDDGRVDFMGLYDNYSSSVKVNEVSVDTTSSNDLSYTGNLDDDDEKIIKEKVNEVKDVEEKKSLFAYDFSIYK